jgi:hypothetical protein
MLMNFKNLGRWFGIAALALALWLVWWCQPERQVRRAQRRLLNAAESKDYTALANLLANDYRDGWGNDKAFVLKHSPRVFDDFKFMLDIDGEIRSVEQAGGDNWWVRQKIVVSGMSGGIGMYARDQVNKLSEPFSMKWRKRGWKPWDWELTGIEQPELRIPRGMEL